MDGSTEAEEAAERVARQRAAIRDAVPITAPPSVAPIQLMTAYQNGNSTAPIHGPAPTVQPGAGAGGAQPAALQTRLAVTNHTGPNADGDFEQSEPA